jgi:dsDNA-specific endonuclease/ATPase MutS2
VAVFAVAAAATWPLAKVFGTRAWWSLAVFGLALLVMTVIVLFAGRADQGPESDEEAEVEPYLEPDRPVTLPVEDRIDLHPFEPRDIPDVVADYLTAAHARGFREVRLIHGRGIGVQRERVRSVLSLHPLVEEFHDAPADRGGWGATVAFLRE